MGTTITDATCGVCISGYTLVSGNCVPCDTGKFKNTSGDRACTSHRDCVNENRQDGILGSTTTDATCGVCISGYTLVSGNCVPCDTGKFKNTSGDGACTSHRVCVNENRQDDISGTTTTDATCGYCLAGYKENGSGNCVEDTVSSGGEAGGGGGTSCDPGYTEDDGNGDCVECESDTYKATAGNQACTPHRVCVDENRQDGILGSTIIDATCGVCLPGYKLDSGSNCVECESGTYKATAGNRECTSHTPSCNGVDNWQNQHPTSIQDRVCTSVTECTDLEYVKTASTIYSNRECEYLPDYNKDPKPRIKNGQNIEGYKCNDGFFTPWIKNVSGDCVEMTQDLNSEDTTPIPQCITTILSQTSYNTFRSKEDCENISFSPDTISDATSLPPVGYIIYDTGWWTDYEELVNTRLEEITYEDGDRAKYANWQRRLQVADILKLKEQAMKKLEECGYKNELAQHQYEGYKEAIESTESYLSELVPKIKEMETFALEQSNKLKHCYDILNNLKDEDEMCKYHLNKDSIFQKYLNTEDITLDESIIEDNYVLDNLLNKDASSIRAFYNGIKVALKDLPISQIDLSNFDKYFKGDDEWDVDKIISNLYLGQLGKLQKISIQEIQNIINKQEYSELKNIVDENNPSISKIIEKIKIIVENSGNKLKIAKASQQLEEVVIEVNNIKGYKLLTDLLMGILLVQYNDANNTYDIQLKLTNDADKKVKILKQIESDAYRKLAELIKLTSQAGDVCSVEYKSEEDIKYDIEQLIEELDKYEDLYDKSNNFYINILDRLKKLHESDVDIKLETTEQKIRQEVIELLNISLYTRAEVEKIIKEKYKKLKIEYLIEYEIYIDEMEIKRKNDEITLLLGIQFEQLIINKEVNKKLNELTATIAGLDNLILTTEHKYEVDVVEWQQELKNLQDKIIILLNKELELYLQLSAITNNIELVLKPEIDRISADITILQGISGTGDAITVKQTEKDAKELELSGQESSKHSIGSNYNSKKEERELELSRYYVLFGSIETNKIAGLEAIVKIKNNHEKILLMQIHFQKELVNESLKLSNTSLDILNKKEEQLFLLEKIQTVKKRDIEYSIRSIDISINFLNNEEISLLKIKDEEEKRENLLSKRQKELYDILKIKEKKIKDLEDSLKNTVNPEYQAVINSDLEIISNETTIERTARLRLNSAQTSLNDIKYKKLLTQLLIYKNNIDINIYKLITKVKEISNYNTEIQILVFKKDIEGLKLNKNKLKLHVLNNEYDRLTKMHKYILIEITTNKKTSLLYDKIKTEIEKSNSVDKIADISSINDLIGENESKLIKLESEKDNIYNKINNISKILKKLNLKINKLEKELIKNVETYEYNIDAKGRSKQQLVEILIQTMSDITKIVTFYNELRDNITKEGIELPLIAILPIEIPNKINNKIHDIFDDTDLDFKTYANKYSFVNQISGILNAFTTDKNDYYIKPAEFKIILNKEYTSILDLADFKNNLKIELTSLLNIDISSLIIKSVNKSSIGNNTIIEAKILGSTYKNPLYIIQDFIKLEIDKSSKIYDLYILKNLISLEYIPKEHDDLLITSPYQNIYNIDISGKNISTSSSQISETFNYARVSCLHENLLIYYQFISKNQNTNDTLKDISINPKIMYQALHGSDIKNIYENYIELDKTLLQVKNINLSNMETFTISFIAKLNQNTNPSQNIILSNGIISEKLSYGTYDNIIKEQIITDNNILSIGFLKSYQSSPTYKLYVKLPCKGKKKYNNITSTDINTGQWYHWIITKDNDKVTIYKNRIMNNDKSIIDTEENILSYSDTQNSHDHLYNNHHEKDICYTDHSIYDSKNLYIGGVKMDIDRFTREINEFTCFKGGLKDLRIYDIKLTKTQIDNIFIENSVDDGTTILGCGGVSTVGATSSSSGGGGGGGSGGGGGGGSGGSGGGSGGGGSFFGASDIAGFSLGSGNTGDKLTELWEKIYAPSLSSTVSTGISQ